MLNNSKKKTKICLFMILATIILIVGIGLSISMGAKEISIQTIVKSVFQSSDDVNMTIVRDVRIPRALAAVLVGGFLGVSGAIMQGVTRNPIADPSIMGITQDDTKCNNR